MKISVVFVVCIMMGTCIQNNLYASEDDFEAKIIKAKEYRLPYNSNYNPKESIKLLKELIVIKPDYYKAHYNLALAYSEDNDYENSVKSFNTALAIRDKNKITDATIFNSAGWVSMKFGDYSKAEILFLKGIDLKDKNTFKSNQSLYNNIGLLYFYTQRFENAKKYLKIAVEQYQSKSAENTLAIINGMKIQQ